MAPRTLLLINPASGRGRALRRVRELRRLAAREGVPVALTRDADDVAARCRDAVARGLERVLVAGGDGTVHYALPALMKTGCVLGLIPTGSGNDLARALALPRDASTAFEVALRGAPRRVDLGLLDGVPFAGVASLGLDGDANGYANAAVPWLRGPLLYAYAALRTLSSFTPFRLTTRCDGRTSEGRALLAAAANTGWYGGGMHVAPSAKVDDGLLDVVIVHDVSRLEVLAWAHTVFRGTHVRHPRVETYPTPRVTFAADRPFDVYADGERVHERVIGPVRVEVVPSALLVASGR